MKEGFDKEIDTLLRRQARGAARSFSGAPPPAAAHLDADELGAFAEGALPAPARVAAAAHLADCDECRAAVVTLSSAPGVVSESRTLAAVPASSAVASPSSWRAWAAAFFSPRVMRFAAPVLALSVVAVVSFVALRSRPDGAPNTARNVNRQASAARESAAAPATTETANANMGGLLDQGEIASSNSNRASASAVSPPVSRGHGGAEEQPPASETVAKDAPESPPPPAAASTEGPAEIAKAAPRPVTSEEQPARPAKSEGEDKSKAAGRAAEPVDELAANDATQQQRRAATPRANEVQTQMPDGSRNQKRGVENNVSSVGGGMAAAPKQVERGDAAGARARAPRSRREAGQEDRRDEDETARVGDTRGAAGHRFRREGSAWVDVNYKPSMPSTGVHRGTEGFRALVADIPEIGRVAEQIGGEVVVVVRGRAYRIR